jgi:hypothetical protein
MAVIGCAVPAWAQPVASTTFEASVGGEAVATITGVCPRCNWAVPGREAVMLKLELDGRYSQHLLITHRGPGAYQVMLGPVSDGQHRLDVFLDDELSSREAGSFAIGNVVAQVVGPDAPGYEKLALAPILYERPNTIGRFSDTPLLMWVEADITPAGRRFRYSVIFSNEDGGTPTDKLMATWGRATDIELVYDVALDATGRVLKEDLQAPKHEIRPFRGKRLGSHPLLWVATDNNMVSAEGESTIRHAPAPFPLVLTDRAREAVMDRNPWTYELMAAELAREHKIDPAAKAGSGMIPDPARYVYIEACGDLSDATAIAFDVGIDRDGRVQWFSTDRGVPEFRIARSGCFRAAAPVPEGVTLPAWPESRLRVRAYRKTADGDTPPPGGPVSAVIKRVNTMFMLGRDYRPVSSLFKWTGQITVGPDAPVEIPR